MVFHINHILGVELKVVVEAAVEVVYVREVDVKAEVMVVVKVVHVGVGVKDDVVVFAVTVGMGSGSGSGSRLSKSIVPSAPLPTAPGG